MTRTVRLTPASRIPPRPLPPTCLACGSDVSGLQCPRCLLPHGKRRRGGILDRPPERA